MSNKCLVTKLKAIANNDNLPMFDEWRLVVPPSDSGKCNINIGVKEANVTKLYSKSPNLLVNGGSELWITDNSRSLPTSVLLENTSNENQILYISRKSNITIIGQTANNNVPSLAFGSGSDKLNIKDLPYFIGIIGDIAYGTNNIVQGTIDDIKVPSRFVYIWYNNITGTFESYVERCIEEGLDNFDMGLQSTSITLNGVAVNSYGNTSMSGSGWTLDNGIYTIKIRGTENVATYNPSAAVGSRWTYN